ncbi:YqcI/YcgG family protein [Oceanobacillus sp. CF4.6]|uniref:YqcI/YcgG family protein n=1 Tax=Oceanobacillus sp. CF4.6 TaxID=3373080 RepID=UPI003EE52F36
MDKTATYLLTKDDMESNTDNLPDWLKEEYKTFESIVTDKTFPCYFGMSGQKRGELRYGYISHNDWSQLPMMLEEFNRLFDNQKKMIRHGFFLFVEPEKEEKPLEYYREYFWNVLQYLHDFDQHEWPSDYPKDPDHYLWNFCFAKEPYFAFGNAPAYKQRKTRDLGNSLIIGFQPRKIFEGLKGTEQSGVMSRERVRERVEKWDGLPKHPNISHYGDKKHREWKQFFIGDDIKPIEGKCPFHAK